MATTETIEPPAAPTERGTSSRARRKTRYNQHEIDAGLSTLIACGGSVSQALEFVDIPEPTLRDWRHRYADRYAELHDRVAPQIEAELARSARETALLAFDATRLGVEKTRLALENDQLKDPAGATRNLATTGAILTDKLLALTGRPTQITEHREPSKLIESLARKGITVSVDPPRLSERQDQ